MAARTRGYLPRFSVKAGWRRHGAIGRRHRTIRDGTGATTPIATQRSQKDSSRSAGKRVELRPFGFGGGCGLFHAPTAPAYRGRKKDHNRNTGLFALAYVRSVATFEKLHQERQGRILRNNTRWGVHAASVIKGCSLRLARASVTPSRPGSGFLHVARDRTCAASVHSPRILDQYVWGGYHGPSRSIGRHAVAILFIPARTGNQPCGHNGIYRGCHMVGRIRMPKFHGDPGLWCVVRYGLRNLRQRRRHFRQRYVERNESDHNPRAAKSYQRSGDRKSHRR